MPTGPTLLTIGVQPLTSDFSSSIFGRTGSVASGAIDASPAAMPCAPALPAMMVNANRGAKRRPRPTGIHHPTDFFGGVAPAAGRLARRTQIGPSKLLGRHQKIWMWRAGYTARNSENCLLSLAFKALPSCRRDGGVPWVPGAGPLSFCWYRLR